MSRYHTKNYSQDIFTFQYGSNQIDIEKVSFEEVYNLHSNMVLIKSYLKIN